MTAFQLCVTRRLSASSLCGSPARPKRRRRLACLAHASVSRVTGAQLSRRSLTLPRPLRWDVRTGQAERHARLSDKQTIIQHAPGHLASVGSRPLTLNASPRRSNTAPFSQPPNAIDSRGWGKHSNEHDHGRTVGYCLHFGCDDHDMPAHRCVPGMITGSLFGPQTPMACTEGAATGQERRV